MPDASEAPTLSPPVAPEADMAEPSLGADNYHVGREIARGGMGSVMLAEDAKLKRTVAVKVMLQDADADPDLRRRFVREAEVLAMLAHPNIVPIYDIVWEDGLPLFYSMKLVKGRTLQAILNDLRHQTPEVAKEFTLDRLLLIFRKVCDAIAFAHSKGVLHRDLKPENVMVGEFGEVLVMDWGIAKTMRHGDPEMGRQGKDEGVSLSSATLHGAVVGSPNYMSPEQAQGEIASLDERSDVFSLGGVLYAILTLRPPFEGNTPGEVLEKVRTGNVAHPTTAGISEPAENTAVAVLPQKVPSALCAVVMKALRAEKSERYSSVSAFSADIEAYQLGFATMAEDAGLVRQVLLLMKRHRGIFQTAAAAGLLLTVAGVWFILQLQTKEQRATAGEVAAKKALKESQQVSGFLKNVLAQAGVYKSLGRDSTMMREILDDTAKTIGKELADQPAVQAELRSLIGRTYEDINEYELGLAQTTEAVRLQRGLHAGDHDGLASALLDHASLLEALGKMKEAEAAIRECLGMYQRLYGEHHTRTGMAHALFSWTLTKSGRALEGEASALLAMDLWRKSTDKIALNNAPRALAIMYSNTKRGDKAVEVKREELEALKKVHGPEHPNVHNCLDNLGFHLVGIGRFDEAEPYLLESLKQGEKFYQDRDPVADHAHACLARIAASRKDWEGQLKHARASMAAAHRVFAKGHRYYREGSAVLARVLLAEAERRTEEAWKTNDTMLASRAKELLDELRGTVDFEAEVKASSAWMDAVHARLLMLAPATVAQGKEQLARALKELRSKAKPAADDTRRLKKAEQWQ